VIFKINADQTIVQFKIDSVKDAFLLSSFPMKCDTCVNNILVTWLKLAINSTSKHCFRQNFCLFDVLNL